MSSTDRRTFLQAAGMAGMFSTVAPAALAQGAAGTVATEKARLPEVAAKHSIRFSVIGLDHAHIYSMTAAVQRGGVAVEPPRSCRSACR